MVAGRFLGSFVVAGRFLGSSVVAGRFSRSRFLSVALSTPSQD